MLRMPMPRWGTVCAATGRVIDALTTLALAFVAVGLLGLGALLLDWEPEAANAVMSVALPIGMVLGLPSQVRVMLRDR